MREKFRTTSKLRSAESEEEHQKDIQRDASKIENEKRARQYIESPVHDISLAQFTLPAKESELLNTSVKEVATKQIATPLFDASIKRQVIKNYYQIPTTNLMQVQVIKEALKIADINLFTVKIDRLPTSLRTHVLKNIQTEKIKVEDAVSHLDLKLESKTLSKQTCALDTKLVITDTERSLEILAFSGGQSQLPFFEEFINCDKRFPRGFSESFNSPFIVLIGEDKYEWHIPIIYALKDLFREITDKYPRVTFREPEVWEEGMEELVDSLDPHSLDRFTFEHKIEFLDARKMHFAVDEFAKVVKGRLNSGFLQQFGMLVIAVRQEDFKGIKEAIKTKGLRVYTCNPDDARYEIFCSKVFGSSAFGEFFHNLKEYKKYLEYTNRRFSIFVKRGTDATDKFQYPLKVATFVYLINDLKNRRKRLINNFEELCKFANEVVGEKKAIEIEVEVEVEVKNNNKNVIPDLAYLPEGRDKIYIEIETLIGTLEPMKKIDETIEKYKNCPNAKTIWVVLKPISAVLHYEELKSRKKAYEILYSDKKIEFKVLTLLTLKKSKGNTTRSLH